MTSETKSWEKTGRSISLHGLGFVQVELGGGQRLHVWHPDLPRRRCFASSQVHDHRFGFVSTVLVGTQINEVVAAACYTGGSHTGCIVQKYKHEGPRSRFGNRPWTAQEGYWELTPVYQEAVEAGSSYEMKPYVFHRTTPGGDGRVATLMRKTGEGQTGATSTCDIGVQPDVDFDRFQWGEDELWRVVREVLCG